MNSVATPWEVSVLRARYHRRDRDHKGYLDRSDVAVICRAATESAAARRRRKQQRAAAAGSAALPADEPEYMDNDQHFNDVVGEVFTAMDLDASGRVHCREFVSFAVAPPIGRGDNVYSDDAVHLANELKRYLRDPTPAIYAGAALGLLPLAKAVVAVVVGVVFADPMRMFRSPTIRTSDAVKSQALDATRKAAEAARKAAPACPIAAEEARRAAMQHHVSLRDACATIGAWRLGGWLALAALVNGVLGVALFVAYAETRAAILASRPPRPNHRRDEPTPMAETIAIEAVSGAVGGVATATLEAPVLAAAKTNFKWDGALGACREQLRAWPARATIAAVSHAAFFVFFNLGCASAHRISAYLPPPESRDGATAERTTLVWATGGCFAGVAYRCVAVPLVNVKNHRKGVRGWFALPAHKAIGAATRGLGSSLAFTVPVTVAAFLVYEAALA